MKSTPPTEQRQASNPTTTSLGSESSEEDLLARLIELEEKLAADLARKDKFQKPKKQAEWQAEIEQLQSRLD